ncbi:RecF/RecN/SMC [Dipodascopsis tothii]|uniref:RecF/RecN/SMC n=1 Tax=Dipodascopsis tothii TaxID=44089 RepID=UPI0034CFBABE
MRLEELIIDGFKSYATRTVISKWDAQFNCITGLNGSGKSNILDAICFVLGITTMSIVRAQNLQDLIYKRGQAGVTKASVTIVFDNRDTANSPIGFEDYPQISITRQIVMGGTSKYLINGHRAQQQTVQNLFQSIQLNINNPNFLIMQGRITKVLNMKPAEILAMIEEAAGTRMFEERRDKALKTMAKKDKKVEEINELLTQEIEPKLEKLRREKRAFLEFQQTQSELERATRVVVAYDYSKYNTVADECGERLAAAEAEAAAVAATVRQTEGEIALLDEDVRRVKEVRSKELLKGAQFQALEQELKDVSHETVRLATLYELKTRAVAEEEARGQALRRTLEELRGAGGGRAAALDAARAEHDAAKAAHDAAALAAARQEELLETLMTGVGAKDGQKSGYMDQLEDARARASQARSEQAQAQLQSTHLARRRDEIAPRAAKARAENEAAQGRLAALRAAAAETERALAALDFDQGAYDAMRAEQAAVEGRVRELRYAIDELKRKVSNVEFSYASPSPGFDRGRVKGLVAQLFSLDADKFAYATALEICAGGRLYNVVVEDEVTGSEILEKGKLRKRVTIIPLNKITPFRVSADKIAAAQALAPGKVDLALSLVGYDAEVSAAMEYVFGSTLVCADADAAKRVTFHPQVRLKSVTVDGDVYDPSGTLSGGSAPGSSGVLVTLQKLNELTRELAGEQARLASMKDVLAQNEAKIKRGTALSQQLDLKRHEAQLLDEQIANSSASAVLGELERVAAEMAAADESGAALAAAAAAADADAARIEREMADFKKNKGRKLEQLKKEVVALRAQAETHAEHARAKQLAFQQLAFDAETAEADIEAAQAALADAEKLWTELQAEVAALAEQRAATAERHQTVADTLEREQSRLSGFNDEIAALEEALAAKAQLVADGSLHRQKLEHALESARAERATAADRLRTLHAQYDWIDDEKELFGRPGSPYDYAGVDMAQAKAAAKQLADRLGEMKKHVNGKVMNMMDSIEKKETALKNMMKTIEKDKRKIEDTIASLDQYKKEALVKTWQQVNVDFGQIFGEMLPGNTARLDPADGDDVSKGIEIRVCLAKVWKESLTELSGGQRSLIALSLIMALLQFKPAPMYILDEVDAALDLSHTQNIGRLIKTRFKGSQFIVVSLKNDMFSNANRVFRTRFQEGTSVVSVV